MAEVITTRSTECITIRIKAVPGAKREQITGLLGDRLKVRVSAPPEGGKANKAICQLLAKALGLKRRDIEVIAGKANAEKVVAVRGIDNLAARARLGLDTKHESDSASS